ncbi:MAG: hypothetical protein WAM91_16475 [Candidatus Acidiferrales bacterium]
MNLRTSFTGDRSNLLAEAGSLDQTMSYVFETPPLLEAASGGRILSYWNTVGDNDTMITLWNHSADDEDFILTFYHQQGQYKLPIHLPANGSRTLSMAWLIRSNQPDVNGNTIPVSITQGSAKLTSAKGDLKRLHVTMHIGVFNVRTATCTCPCDYCDPYEGQEVDPNDLTGTDALSVGDEIGFTATVYLEDGPVDVTGDADWESDDTDVADFGFESYGITIVANGGGDAEITGNLPSDETFDANSGGDCNWGGEEEYENVCGETNAGTFYIEVEVVPPIKIEFGTQNQDITENPQSVVLGQQILLTAAYDMSHFDSSVTVQKQEWSDVGDAAMVGGVSYTTASGSTSFAVLDQQSTTYYYYDCNSGSICNGDDQFVTFTLTLSDGATSKDHTDFDVSGPALPSVSTSIGQWAINSPGPLLQLGSNSNPSNIGILFTASAIPPAGFSNHFEWFQLMGTFTIVVSSPGQTLTCSPVGVPGLDGQYPYPPQTSTTVDDNPDVGLQSSGEVVPPLVET